MKKSELMDVLNKISTSIESIEHHLIESSDNTNYTYAVVRVNDDGTAFSAALAQLGDNGFHFVQILYKELGKYQILIRKKNDP